MCMYICTYIYIHTHLYVYAYGTNYFRNITAKPRLAPVTSAPVSPGTSLLTG